MTFNFNPLSSLNQNLTNVQKSSKTSDGGAGNTGYFARGKNEQEEQQIIFETDDYPKDTFEYEKEEKVESDGLLSILKKLVLKLKKAFLKLFKKK